MRRPFESLRTGPSISPFDGLRAGPSTSSGQAQDERGEGEGVRGMDVGGIVDRGAGLCWNWPILRLSGGG